MSGDTFGVDIPYLEGLVRDIEYAKTVDDAESALVALLNVTDNALRAVQKLKEGDNPRERGDDDGTEYADPRHPEES